MGRSHIDENGFKVIEAMPISVVGVFPYLGKQIDYDGEMGLEPNKVYYVFRSPEELFDKEAMSSFNGKPFIDNHEMLGKGFKPVDKRPADGTIYNVRRSKDMPDYLIADTNIFTEKMIRKIADGKRELSLGYRCQYVPEAGTWNGIPYQFKQTNLRGNHLALVEHGRCGSSVCVCDGALVTMDSLPKEILDMEKEKDEKKGAKALASKLDACLQGGDEEGCQDCLEFLDLSPEQRKSALKAVKAAKGEGKAAPAEDSKAKDDDVIPPPPEKGSDKEDDEEDEGKAPAPAPAPAAEAPAPTEKVEVAAAEETEEAPAADCKAKDCGTKDCKPKKKTEDAGEPCCKEGKGGKPCCEDKEEKKDGCCDGEAATATAPSIPVPVAKVKDDCPECGKDDEECKCKEEVKEKVVISKDEMDAITARVRADYHRAQKLANAIRPVVGAFDSAEMSEAQVARHAVQNIPALAFAADSADDVVLGVVRGYIANRASAHQQPTSFKVATAADEAPKTKESASDAETVAASLRKFYN